MERVTVTTELNDCRYVGRQGTIVKEYENGGAIVQLDDWTPGLEPPNGKLYLNADEYQVNRG